MGLYVNKISVKKLYHIENLEIALEDKNHPHLVITGKNGSGKTVLLRAIADFLDKVKNDESFQFLKYVAYLESARKRSANAKTPLARSKIEKELKHWESEVNKSVCGFTDAEAIIGKYGTGDFVIAFYQADRKPQMKEPKNPTKPQIKKTAHITETYSSQFLYFLSDLKIQEALARNEGKTGDADKIKDWFVSFERVLKRIFDDNDLELVFNYRDYTFKITTKEKSFGFNQMSDGFAAALDIVSDLILKMQEGESPTYVYEKTESF